MAKRSYAQYCALARAFDVVGERWTPLLLRELALGPRRYADLVEGLPGIGTSLLAERLRDLEAEGIVRRGYLPPPAARRIYELTEEGAELAAALLPLARWGVRRLGRPRDDEAFSLSWMLLFMRAAADTEAARGVHDVYEMHTQGQVFHVIVDDGSIDARPGPAPRPPDLVVRADVEVLAAMASGELLAADALASGTLAVEGDEGAQIRSLQILAPAALGAPAVGAPR
jgi:DNA-binding HxlR family transcriptional regulator/putative sterol carrier protein